MKIKIFGDALIITSALKEQDIKTVEKFCPEMLVLKETIDNKPQAVFALGLGAAGGFNKNGVIFDSKDQDGFACVTLCGNPTDLSQTEKAQQFIENNARAIAYAIKLEEQIGQALTEHAALIDSVTNVVEIVG